MKPLDYLNLAWIRLRSYPKLRRIWGGGRGKGREIRVNYGHEQVPGPDVHAFGGLVKLQDLSRVFPQCLDRPNILYLVSSSLPYFPVRLAKMARSAGAKIVLNQNGVAYPGWYGDGWEKANRAMAYLHSVADYVFYQSRFCRESAARYLGERASDDGAEVLYNPVDTETFHPADARENPDGTIRLLLSGSHWTTYRVFAALETVKRVAGTEDRIALRIAGRYCWDDDPEAAARQVAAYAAQLGIGERVVYTGPYSQREAVSLMNSCAILLHTKYNDPCPRLVVEAMACGLPVVYSATGGVAELVGDEAGVGVPGPLDWEQDHPPEPEELAAGVLEVIGDLPSYSRAARRRAVARFDLGPWLDRHEAVFTGLLADD